MEGIRVMTLFLPYVIVSLVFLGFASGRHRSDTKAILFLLSMAAMALIVIRLALRTPAGDSGRYYLLFSKIQEMGVVHAIATLDVDYLFVTVLWIIGIFGHSSTFFFGAFLLLYLFLLVCAVRISTGNLGSSLVILLYSIYPFFVAYGASGLRQGLALVILLVGYASLHAGKRTSWLWILLAPFAHNGAWLAVGVVIMHQTSLMLFKTDKYRWALILTLYFGIVFSTAVGVDFRSFLPDTDIAQKQQFYLDEVNLKFNYYRTGFRLDFVLFSIFPLVSGFWATGQISLPSINSKAGWWLSLYLSLNIIYHVFSFAAFSDRFAAFSWFILPLIIYFQVEATGKMKKFQEFAIYSILGNLVILGLYTRNFFDPIL